MTRDGLRRALTAAPLRLAAAVVLVAIAYHYSLSTLVRDWRYSTPLADLVLVPPLAVVLLAAATLRHRHVEAVRLGRLDVVVAVPCIVLALLASTVAPVTMSAYYWPARLDLLALPLFAAAAVALLFGTRALVAYAFPLLFLFLAWPLPLTVALERSLTALTDGTAALVTAALAVVPVAERIDGAGDAVFLVGGDAPFAVSVASACAGAEGLVGFAIVAAALLYVIRGPLRNRAAWLLAGLALAWIANVVRIVAILATGNLFGEDVAMGGLHPVGGLLALNATLLAMLTLLGRFGLHRRPIRDRGHADSPMSRAVAPAERATPRAIGLRLAALALPALALGVANADLARADDVYSGDGRPAARAFGSSPSAGAGLDVTPVGEFGWARTYFGDDSSWTRYRLDAETGGHPLSVWVDAIVTSDLGALAAHPVRRCYDFHGNPVNVDQRVTLAQGVIGRLFAYEVDGERWHALSWEWPVRDAGGDVRHERLTLLASTHLTGGPPPTSAPDGVVSSRIVAALNSLGPDEDDNRGLSRALAAVADRLIEGRTAG